MDFKLNNDDYDKFFELITIQSLDAWKKLNKIQNKFLNIINYEINYFNILELKEIRKKLDQISIIQNLIVKSISYKKIEYEIYFYGNLNIFNNLITLSELVLDNKMNFCKIKLK